MTEENSIKKSVVPEKNQLISMKILKQIYIII